jgi:hypothetical protein
MEEQPIIIYSDEESRESAIPVESGVYIAPGGCLPFLFMNQKGSSDFVCPQLELTFDMCDLADKYPDFQNQFWSQDPMYVCVKSDIFEKHGFQMMGPGWKWIPNEAKWEEVPKPSESGDRVWSNIHTWERRCSNCSNCGDLEFDLEEKGWMLNLQGAKKLFRSDGNCFCGNRCICDFCHQIYNPTDPVQKERHTVITSERDSEWTTDTAPCLL